MSTKQGLIADLKVVFNEWERLLNTAAERHLVARHVTSKWTLKDAVAHLMGWQQLSIARMKAAMAGGEPEMPAWLQGLDPFDEEHLHEFNANIQAIHDAEPWPEVERAWRAGFARLIELAEAIPEEALLEANRYPWLRGNALAGVLEGTCAHHREHLAATLRALGD